MAVATKRQKKRSGTNTTQSPRESVVLGAAAAALAAASYYFFGPGGKKHRTQAHGWMLKMKGETVHRLEGIGDVSEDAYNALLDSIGKEYASAKAASRAEIVAAVADMKKAWKTILKEGGAPARGTKRSVSKSKKA